MEIKTLFKIGDLVQSKYSAKKIDPEFKRGVTWNAHEVIYVKTETCSAGTQVFYLTRPIAIEFKKEWNDEVKPEQAKYAIAHGITKQGEQPPSYREDEIIPLCEDVRKLIEERP